MLLFEELAILDPGKKDLYRKCFEIFLEWMKAYPLRTNKWGPFFEDIPGWSNTQTNAISFAMFILNHRDLFPEWKSEVKGIIGWTYNELGNHEYEKYKVTVMNEQTVYRVPGNSHSSRQASVELMYAELSGDTTYTGNAVRTLNWATYTVSSDGRNRYIRDDVWLTDGYGDYVRHYLRAMAAKPDLAPFENHLLKSSSIVKSIDYKEDKIKFSTFDDHADVELKLVSKPFEIRLNGEIILLGDSIDDNSWTWSPAVKGGVVNLHYFGGNTIEIII